MRLSTKSASGKVLFAGSRAKHSASVMQRLRCYRWIAGVPLLVMQAAPTASERLAHLLKAQRYAALILTTSLTAAGAQSPLVVPSSSSDGNETSPAAAQLQQSAAESTTDVERSPFADSQLAATQLLSSTSPAASPAPADAGAESQPCTKELSNIDELPTQLLGWACWQPQPALLAALAAAAGKDKRSNSSGHGTATGQDTAQQQEPQTAGPTAAAVASAGLCAAQGLGSCALQVPELLLSNLQLLAGSLKEAGQHLAALPVLQIARLVAQVALDSQVSA
jgi:hypothetical protein